MKWIFFFILPAIIFSAACNKDIRDDKSLIGIWVEKTNRKDSLVVYRENNRFMMFDNSAVYRDFRGQWMTDDAFRQEFKLKKDQIGFKLDTSSDEFIDYPFQWIHRDREFTMSINGLRPYLSSLGTATYERVK